MCSRPISHMVLVQQVMIFQMMNLNDYKPCSHLKTIIMLVRILGIVICLLIIISQLPAIFLSGRNGSSTTDKLGKVIMDSLFSMIQITQSSVSLFTFHSDALQLLQVK